MHKPILVVDDDPVIRGLIENVLRIEHYCVRSVSDGSEALSHIELYGRPALILLDLMMPVMDGCEFLSVREANPYLSSIPVLVISAVPEKAALFSIKGALAKPFSIQALLDAVQKTGAVSTCEFGADCLSANTELAINADSPIISV